MKRIVRIVLTGGPCAGKTSSVKYLREFFFKNNFYVFTLSEVATDLITNGITPWTCGLYDYQKYEISLQLFREKIFYEAALNMEQDNIVIISDRGVLDNKAYMKSEDYYRLLKELGTNEKKVISNYDAIFHLVTAAKDAPDYYSLQNNMARRESIEEAIELDDKIIDACDVHPRFYLIYEPSSFDKKISKLIEAVYTFINSEYTGIIKCH